MPPRRCHGDADPAADGLSAWNRRTGPSHNDKKTTTTAKSFSLPFIGLGLLFAAVLAYQTTWQLAGVFRLQFVTFMQAHDRREINPAHRIQRGRILDHGGLPKCRALQLT